MDVRNKNNNIGFGTAFATFHKSSVESFSKSAQNKVNKFVYNGIRNFAYKSGVLISEGHPYKTIIKSTDTGMAGIQFTHKNPNEEAMFIKQLRALFGNQSKNIKTDVIPNKVDNIGVIHRYNMLQEIAVKEGGSVADVFIRNQNTVKI